MKKLIAVFFGLLFCLGSVLSSACADGGTWFCPQCGKELSGEFNFCPKDGTANPGEGGGGGSSDSVYDMGTPDLRGQSYGLDQMNLTVYWVQVQLKATGVYYQGYAWDETGNLGDQTMKEIAAFMKSRGYNGHSGRVDQTVVDELSAYLGSRRVPVYIGGFYRHMDSIMSGGHTGSMQKIVSNLIDMIPHETLGARWVQCCLSKLGYYTGTIDGKYGERTEQAVKKFQKAYGFQERNYVTLGVARAMLEACYNNGCYLDDLP